MNSLDIDITGKCNLNCSYCYYRKQQKDFDERHIGKIKSLNPDTIHIMGGEPLLNFPGIVKVISTIEPIRWNITSNLLNLEPYMANFIKIKGGYINASLDGPKGDRLGYNEAIDIYKKFRHIIPMCRLTVTKNTVGYLYENIRSINLLGLKKIAIGFSEDIDWKVYKNQLKHIVSLPIETNIYKHHKRCKAGTDLVALSVDGGMFPCHRFTSSILPFKNTKDIKAFVSSIDNPACIGTRCSLHRICSKGCLYNLYKGQYFHCDFMRATYNR